MNDSTRSVILLALLGAAVLAGGVRAAWAQEEIYVTNFTANSITVYERTANGAIAPTRVIQGPATGLNLPVGVVVDAVHDELVVGNSNGGGITVYARTASGNAAPLRTITGQFVRGVIVDTVHDEIIAVAGPTVRVYSRTATGNAVALRVIEGPATGLDPSVGVALDLIHNEIFITSTNNDSIRVFSRLANGNAAPLRAIQGAATGLDAPWGIALDLAHDEIVVADASTSTVRVFARTATGNVAPLRTLSGAATGIAGPHGVAIDLAHDELLVTNQSNSSVRVHTRGASGNVAPLRSIQGLGTELNSSQFAAVTTSPPVVAAVLPTSRSVQVGATATAFATIINAGAGPVQHCAPKPITTVPGPYLFQTTNPSNQPVGAPNTPAIVPPGGTQNFVFALSPTSAFGPADVRLGFVCDGTNLAPIIAGLNTLLLVASPGPVPDLIALAATISNDGIVDIPGAVAAAAFAVATVNVGNAGTITVSADTGGAALGLTLTVCQTTGGGACMADPSPTVALFVPNGATPTFSIFLVSSGVVPFDPAGSRIFVRFKDVGKVTRGSTSVAVRTQ